MMIRLLVLSFIVGTSALQKFLRLMNFTIEQVA